MSEADQEWIEKRIAEARKGSPVSEANALVLKAQMRGTMRERTLRPAELADLAKSLLSEATKPTGGDAAS